MEWIEKPLTFEAIVGQDKVYDYDRAEIGAITHSEQHYNHRIKCTMRSIRVTGSNGAQYYGRYEASRIVVILKRCTAKTARPPRYRNKGERQ